METEHPTPPGRGIRLPRLLLSLAVTAALLLLLWRYFDAEAFLRLLRNSQPSYLLAALGCYLLVYAARSQRFLMVSRASSWGRIFCITCVHNFLLRILPLRTGDLSYAWLVRRFGLSGFGHGVISLILVRVLDAATVVCLFATALAFEHGTEFVARRTALLAAAGFVLLSGAALLYFDRLLRLGHRALLLVARALCLYRLGPIRRFVDKIPGAIASFERTPPPLLLKLGALSLVHWLLIMTAIFFTMRAFSVKLSWAAAILGGSAPVAASFLPVGGIGTFGSMEAGWALGFVLVGVKSEVAVATGIAFSLLTLAFGAAMALVGWLGLQRASRHAAATVDPLRREVEPSTSPLSEPK